MARITAPFIIKPEFSTNNSYKSKSINMEKLIDRDFLKEMTIFEMRIILLIQSSKGRKTKLEDAEENQTIDLSLSKNADLFTTPKGYYAAIKRLSERGFLTKIEGKQSLYRVNPHIINNMTYEQSVSTGVKQDYSFKNK